MTRYIYSSFDEESKLLDFLKMKTDGSNREIKAALDRGYCKVNGLIETIATRQLRIKDTVELASLWHDWIHEKIPPISTLYEDEDFFIIDKPIGVVSEEEEIQVAIQQNYFLVHRLDKETSGVLILTKNDSMKNKMMDLFRDRKVKKKYVALLDGELEQKQGKIETYLTLKARLHGQRIYISNREKIGDHALTYFEQIGSAPSVTAVLCSPVTGRTHQIRAQFKGLNHPILGDILYEKQFQYPHFAKRLFLHSYSVEFQHPKHLKLLNIKAPLPVEFNEIVQNLKLP